MKITYEGSDQFKGDKLLNAHIQLTLRYVLEKQSGQVTLPTHWVLLECEIP